MKKVLHIISHTHWDREWYMSFEQHRARLVELLDALILKMESDPQYRYYHLDGQMIVLEDYLEIKPEMKPRLDRLIHEGRIQVGPWYVLQDEFLISGEANVRNMMEGLRCCAENGYDPVMTGYLPDSFGNISQMPQILKGFGIDNAVFGRGVSTVFGDNMSTEDSGINREWNWYGADGSGVMGVLFTYWYDNANELPVEPEKVRSVYGDLIKKTAEVAGTPHLLGMNGCDHQPVQLNLPESLEVANEIFGEALEIRHSNFKEYLECLRPYAKDFKPIYGELTDQRTGGIHRLVDTATTHLPLKQSNHRAQNMLQQQSEPISAMSALAGDPYREHLLRYAWKTLMKNHPHDSICTCSCDEVAREMGVRFEKACQVAAYVRDEAADHIVRHIDTARDSDHNIIVFHTSPKCTDGVVAADIYMDEYEEPENLYITDRQGNVIPAQITYCGKKFTYTLPKDSFRKVRVCHVYQVRFSVCLSGLGYFAYRLEKGRARSAATDICLLENGAENSFISFRIENDGSLTVVDKVSGRCYTGLHSFEDSGDCGDSYNYRQTQDQLSISTHREASCRLVEQTAFSATYEVTVTMDIPRGLNSDKTRSAETVCHTINSRITLNARSRRIEITTRLRNQSENHRLRAQFPTNIQTQTSFADGQFDVIQRDIIPWEGWQNPSCTQRMQAFCGLEDAQSGILIAGRGLHAYEVLRDGKNTLALDLLRAVGEIGDWGDFPTPEMQVKQDLELHYAIIPYALPDRPKAFDSGYTFAEDQFFALQTGKHDGVLEANRPLVCLEGDLVTCTAVKQAEDRSGVVVRLCNVSGTPQKIGFGYRQDMFESIRQIDLAESRTCSEIMDTGHIKQELLPKKIATYLLKYRR